MKRNTSNQLQIETEMRTDMKNLLVGQSGGPTAVINASLYGVVKAALASPEIDHVYGMVNGIEGMLQDHTIDLGESLSETELELLKLTPAAYLGSCRYKLPESLTDAFYEIGRAYEDEMGVNLLHYGITLLLTYVVGPFITMVTLFGALTIGQLSSKHKGFMGILAYAGVTILSSIIGSTVQSAFMFGTNVMSSQSGISVSANSVYDINVITSLLLAAIMYGVSYYIMNKKLNLD